MLYSLLLALACLKFVSSSLYPTRPIADTTFISGQLASITWIDDNTHKPQLLQMGPLKIDLYAGKHTYVKTLANNVSPGARSLNVTLPTNLSAYGSAYTLRFTSKRPAPLTVYTALFTIIDNATAFELNPISTANINGTQLLLTLVLPSSTIVSELTPTPSFAASSTVVANPLPSSSDGLNRVLNGGVSTTGKRFDMEKFKFRLVFIVWPALIGLSMAM